MDNWELLYRELDRSRAESDLRPRSTIDIEQLAYALAAQFKTDKEKPKVDQEDTDMEQRP